VLLATMKLFTKTKARNEWNSTSILEFDSIEKCWESSSGTPRTIWNASTWKTLQQTYREIVGEEESTISLEEESGLTVPHEIKNTAVKGRGIYATANIKAGDLVWQPTQHAVFRKEIYFRRFLSTLSYDLACDVLMWAYVEKCDCLDDSDDDDECFAAVVELDEGSFMNSVSHDEVPHVGECDYDLTTLNQCSKGMDIEYALRDIEAGEEILTNYATFDIEDELDWFDNIFDNAWWWNDHDMSSIVISSNKTFVGGAESMKSPGSYAIVPFFLVSFLYYCKKPWQNILKI